MQTVKTLLDDAERQIVDSDTPRLDAEVLLGHVMGRNRAWLYTWPEKCPDEACAQRFKELVERRALGEPIAYLTGIKEFWGLPLQCDATTLIPRPETELLVSVALELPLPEQATVLDLGTGTGAIALALAREKPRWQIHATDCVAGAIKLAKTNAKNLGVKNVSWHGGDWFQTLEADLRFDLIVSNPPYVCADDPHLELGDVRFEPRSALVAGDDGLAAIRRLASIAGQWMNSHSWLLLEHGYNQAASVSNILHSEGFSSLRYFEDLNGHRRASLGYRIS